MDTPRPVAADPFFRTPTWASRAVALDVLVFWMVCGPYILFGQARGRLPAPTCWWVGSGRVDNAIERRPQTTPASLPELLGRGAQEQVRSAAGMTFCFCSRL